MGAYDGEEARCGGGDDGRSQWNSPAERGGVAGLAERLAALGVGDASSQQSLFQVIHAVEAAESIITQQFEENKKLRMELQMRTRELEKYTTDALPDPSLESAKAHLPISFGMTEGLESEAKIDGQLNSDHSKINGILDLGVGGQSAVDSAKISRLSSPSSRYQREGDDDSKSSLFDNGLMPMSDSNNASNRWKQDLILKVREHEEEISQLRKHLADYSMKEAQICNEKHVLEKRIAYMRSAFDQQQQDLVEAASKALTYRQDIIEENMRLKYALQAAQEERSTFVTCLVPLLSEYGFQPPVSDALSIVNSLKVLFNHLHEKLLMTETKLKASHYQITPWHSNPLNSNTGFTVQSPAHSYGSALVTTNQNNLEIVPQQVYANVQTPISSPLNKLAKVAAWDSPSHSAGHQFSTGGTAKQFDHDNLGGASPFNSGFSGNDTPVRNVVSQVETTPFRGNQYNREPSFTSLATPPEADDTNTNQAQSTREPTVHWATGTSTYVTPASEDPGSAYSPYLPPVLEEPSSSFSEAADDDPLPAIEGLQITGDAFPGRELRACGYMTNGTTSCNFEWVRYLEDGSVNYIAGAKQPDYLVIADDVDSYLAIEVQPLDNRKRKGELVKVFANDQRKITCDPEMQEKIEKIHFTRQASFEVSLFAGIMDIWEPAILAIKREGYSIKCIGPRGVVVTEKFSSSTNVTIPLRIPAGFSLHSSEDVEYLLRTDNNMTRDSIVLTLRLFIRTASEKKKGKKRGLFFK